MGTVQTITLVAAGVVSLLTYLVAFAWVLQKRSTARRAANYVLLALGLLTLSWLSATFTYQLLSKYVSPAEFGNIVVFIQLLNRTIFAIALGLLVAAAFVDRSGNDTGFGSDEYLLDQQTTVVPDENPYSAR